MNLFDTHAHLNDEAFDTDRVQIINELRKDKITVLNCGYDRTSSEKAITLAEENDLFYAAVGIHPENTEGYCFELCSELLKWLKKPKVVALGEIGLDYHYEGYDSLIQKDIFSNQLTIAAEAGKPVCIHSRDAVSDTYEIIKKNLNTNSSGVMHSFNQSKEMLKKYLDLNMYFGISGPVTFKNAANLKELVKYIPMDRLLIETDSPYLTPVPYRGKRNSPSYVKYVAQELSQLKEIDFDELCNTTFQNAKRLFSV